MTGLSEKRIWEDADGAVVDMAVAASIPPSVLGGKAANLAKLNTLGCNVPPWFAIPATIYSEALRLGGIPLQVAEILKQIVWDEAGSIRRASSQISNLILAVPVPGKIKRAIIGAYERLGRGRDVPVAVRSSAVGEDSATQSFAGQLDSFLFVHGHEALLRSVAACWASGYSERALAYRHQNGLDQRAVAVGVVIQEMVFGEVSGVLFTANAISGDENQAVVSATYGLGEGLVSGELDADNWIIDRKTRKQVHADIATKTHCIVLDTERGHGTARVEVREASRDLPSLTTDQLAEVLALGDDIAQKLGSPQDIEWTIRKGEIFLLQTRPITTLKAKPQGAYRLWDNSNIAESYYGITTPLTFSFVNRMYEVAYQVLFDAFGIPARVLRDNQGVFANLLGLLKGRIYYNLGNYYELATFLPAYDYIKDFFDTMIGVQERQAHQRKKLGIFRRVFVGIPQMTLLALRIFANFLKWDREVADFQQRFAIIFEDFRKKAYSQIGSDKCLEAYRQLERDLMWKWRAPMTNDFYAMVFFGLLKKLIAKWDIDLTTSLSNDLLCGEGDLESTKPAKELIRLAIMVREDAELLQVFNNTPESQIKIVLGLPNNRVKFSIFVEQMDQYLNNYGFRCMGELKLEVKNLIEDPTFVYTMIKNYIQKEDLDLRKMEAKEKEIRRIAEVQVANALRMRPVRRILFSWVLSNARKGVRHRENLRMARTKAFGLVRQIFGGIGADFSKLGAIGTPDDIFYLELAECFAWVEGRATTTNLRALVALRKAEFAAYGNEDVSDRLETAGPVYYGDQFYTPGRDSTDDGPELQGTSCCPGRVSGVAKLILKPTDDMRLAGEILVTERTDPGWVPLYPSAAGLLIERGSLLSHAAVVARELGLPTIIGIRNLTGRIQSGQRLSMDARAGTVRLE